MAPTGARFKEGVVPFEMNLTGTVNGKPFSIRGKGAGDATKGKLKGKWFLTKPKPAREGKEMVKCPMAWGVLAPTFAYGFKCFAKYPGTEEVKLKNNKDKAKSEEDKPKDDKEDDKDKAKSEEDKTKDDKEDDKDKAKNEEDKTKDDKEDDKDKAKSEEDKPKDDKEDDEDKANSEEDKPKDDSEIFSYFHECFQAEPTGDKKGEHFSSGYSQRRVTRFGRLCGNDDPVEEGIMNSFHEIKFQEAMVEGELSWVVKNTVTVEATFNKDSPLLKNDGADIFLQSLERTVPFEDGVKNYVQYFYPIPDKHNKDSVKDDIIIATQMTHNRPHCTHCSYKIVEDKFVHNSKNKCCRTQEIRVPKAHFKRTECKQWKDPNDKRDHVMQDEVNEYFSFEHEGVWTEIGMPEIESMSRDLDLGRYRTDI